MFRKHSDRQRVIFFVALTLFSLSHFAGCENGSAPSASTDSSAPSHDGSADSASVSIELAEPTDDKPVSWGAVVSDNTLVVQAKIKDGWHIYATEGDVGVGRHTKFELNLPEGITAASDWKVPTAKVKATSLGRVAEYSHAATFSVPLQVAENIGDGANVGCAIAYQACTDSRCLPPTTEMQTVPISK